MGKEDLTLFVELVTPALLNGELLPTVSNNCWNIRQQGMPGKQLMVYKE